MDEIEEQLADGSCWKILLSFGFDYGICYTMPNVGEMEVNLFC